MSKNNKKKPLSEKLWDLKLEIFGGLFTTFISVLLVSNENTGGDVTKINIWNVNESLLTVVLGIAILIGIGFAIRLVYAIFIVSDFIDVTSDGDIDSMGDTDDWIDFLS